MYIERAFLTQLYGKKKFTGHFGSAATVGGCIFAKGALNALLGFNAGHDDRPLRGGLMPAVLLCQQWER